MDEAKADKKEDIRPVPDREEPVSLMEPMLISASARERGALTDLALELAQKAAGFRRSLPENLLASLVDLVRAMNCYYSNLIEGHDTHPVDIERALKNDYSQDSKKRDLQLEAKAHINVQRWIDGGGLRGRIASAASIQELHSRFCEHLPDDLLWVKDPATDERVRVVPGTLRGRDVGVGTHVAVSPGAVPRFLERFEQVYGNLGRTESILAAAAAHHRLLWIHPFVDGNGRVARLLSHAMLLESLDTGGVWSVARGLARNVQAYKSHLAACDQTRRNDLDGRGHLSEEALSAFTSFFLNTCIDQVTFMEGLMQPDRLRARILLWAEEETRLGKLPPKAGAVLEAVLYRGALPRGDVAELLGSTPRHARRIVAELLDQGVLTSDGVRDPLRLAFPATLASRWMPNLFPEKVEAAEAEANSSKLLRDAAGLAEQFPEAAVTVGWSAIERELRAATQRTGTDADSRLVLKQIERLRANGHIDEWLLDNLMRMRNLRNVAAHGGTDRISPDEAREFVAMADEALQMLQRIPGAKR